MPNLTYTVSQFLPFTKIVSGDVNQYFTDIKTLLNTTKLDSTNVQQYGLSRDRLAQTTANAVVVNDGSGTMTAEAQLATSRGGLGFAPTVSSGTAGQAIIVNAAGNSLALGSPSQATLKQAPASDIASFTAGEAISANDAVCYDISLDGSSSNIYRVFKANGAKASRRNSFIGFATAAATVTPHIETWVASINFVASNVITYKINGRGYTTNFTTDNATTLQAVATQMATDPDVASASSDGSHTITVTGIGGIFVNITTSTVTGGASQATITVTTTQTPSGQGVTCQNFGDMAGFSSLTTGLNYYLSNSVAGQITSNPTDTNPVFVGQALSSTILFVNRNVGQFQFTTPTSFVKAGGSSTNAAANVQSNSEHFNNSAWSIGVAAPFSRFAANSGDSVYNGFLYFTEGQDSTGTAGALNYSYNKTAWAVQANRTNPKHSSASAAFSGYLYYGGGRKDGVGLMADVDRYNGSAWGNVVASLAAAKNSAGCFTQGAQVHWCGGSDGVSAGLNTHNQYDGASMTTTTVVPISDIWGHGSGTSSGGLISGNASAGTASYKWSGSWSASATVTYGADALLNTTSIRSGGASGYFTGNAQAMIAGGYSGAALTTSATFNDTSWTAGTASSTAREAPTGGVL